MELNRLYEAYFRSKLNTKANRNEESPKRESINNLSLEEIAIGKGK